MRTHRWLRAGDIVRLKSRIPESEYWNVTGSPTVMPYSPFHDKQFCGANETHNFCNTQIRFQSQALRVEYHVTRDTVECSALDRDNSESFSVLVAWLDLRSPLELLAEAAEAAEDSN